jgi:hypothetical protein
VTHGSLFSGIAGFDAGFDEAGMETIWQVELEPFCRAVLATHFPKAQRAVDIRTCRGLTASVPASHVRTFQSQANGLGFRESELDSFITLRESCESFDPLGLSSRMFPDFSVRTRAETLQKSSGFSWSGAGMGLHGVCLTASFSESPNDAHVCSLSDVLESHVPPRFYLSPRACAGILRRAEKRGRKLATRLELALQAGASQQEQSKPIAEQSGGSDTPLPSDGTSHLVRQCESENSAMPCKPAPQAIQQSLTIRRLTPTECESLQGFPQGWTLPDTEHWATRSRKTSQSGLAVESSKRRDK